MNVLIIIPAYNEGENIKRVVSNIVENYPQYDYIVINDGSYDDTATKCRENNYKIVDLPVNLGLAGGFQVGMRYADRHGYEYAIQFDGDGQHNPEYIAEMLNEISQKRLDFCIGSRFVAEKKIKSLRILGNTFIQLMMRITTGKVIRDPTSGMRIYNKRLINIFSHTLDFGPEPDTLAYLIRSGARFSEVHVQMNERIAGESYLNITSSIKYMLRIFFSIVFMQWFRKRIVL